MTLSAAILLGALRPAWGAGAVTGLPRLVLVLCSGVALAGGIGWWLHGRELEESAAVLVGGLAGVIAAALTAGASLLVEPRLRQAVRRAP